jgi:Predicted hydrolase of the alpha/beta-hydrolase fold
VADGNGQYVGEEGANCSLKGAVVVGNPFDLELANKALQRTQLGRLYSRIMGCTSPQTCSMILRLASQLLTTLAANMKRLMDLHKDEIIKYTNLNFDRIQNITYLHEFDREVQYVFAFNLCCLA